MGTHACTHARLLGAIKQFAKTSFQSLAFCPSAGHHPTRGWAKAPRLRRAARPPHSTRKRCLLGHGFRITEADRLSPSVPTFVDCKQLTISRGDKTQPRAWQNSSYSSLLLGPRLPDSHGCRQPVRTDQLAKPGGSLLVCRQVHRGEDAVCGNVNTAGTILWGCAPVAACPASAKGMKSQGGVAQEESGPARAAPAEEPGCTTLLGDGLRAKPARCLLASHP